MLGPTSSKGTGRLLRTPAPRVRPWRVALFLAVALACVAFMGRPVQTITIGTPSDASAPPSGPTFASVAVAQESTTSNAAVSVSVGDVWTAQDWLEWEAKVPRVPAPEGISANGPLRVEVVALGPTGWGVPDASVQITWILPSGQYEDDCTTGLFGHANATRMLDESCRGKRCVVAVSVSRDGKSGQAYSVFVPK